MSASADMPRQPDEAVEDAHRLLGEAIDALQDAGWTNDALHVLETLHAALRATGCDLAEEHECVGDTVPVLLTSTFNREWVMWCETAITRHAAMVEAVSYRPGEA